MRRALPLAVLAVWLAWCAAAVWFGGVGPSGPLPWRAVALALGIGVLALGARAGRGSVVGLALAAGISLWYATLRPAADRGWTEDQSRLPHVEVQGDVLRVHDLRTFRYRSPDDWDPHWEDREWDLTRLEGVDFGVARFSALEAVAHTLVSFRFTDAPPLVVSVEIRKERGEHYGPISGLFRQFELMYVLADERDALELRAAYYDDPVFLHPMRATPAQTRMFLEEVLRGAQALETRPAFYNTVTASCTSVLARHLQASFDLPLDYRIYLPGYADALAFDRGLIATDVDLAATRARNRINERAHVAAGTPGFSRAIREGRSDR